MERLLARLAHRLATCRSRRWVPSAGAPVRGRLDPRRSYRRALATGGEVLRFARRERAVEEPRLVFLCDTSGSMDAHTRFLLMFVLALRRAARRAELFAFNTELVDLGRDVVPGKIRLTLERLAARVPDWSGGTRLGESLATFASRHLPRLGGPRTIVVVLSDGLDRGDPAELAAAVRRIRARVRAAGLAEPAARRSALRADRARHGGRASLHRLLRARAQPRVAGAAPSSTGGLIMGLRFEHAFTVKARPEKVWAYLTDPYRVAPALPGAAITEKTGEGTWNGTITVKVGPVAAKYKGTVRFESMDPAARTATIVARGQDLSGRGGADMKMESRLSEKTPGETEVAMVSDVNVTGIMAQFGRGLVQDVSNQMFQKFTEAVRAELERPDEPAAAAPAPQKPRRHRRRPPRSERRPRRSRPSSPRHPQFRKHGGLSPASPRPPDAAPADRSVFFRRQDPGAGDRAYDAPSAVLDRGRSERLVLVYRLFCVEAFGLD